MTTVACRKHVNICRQPLLVPRTSAGAGAAVQDAARSMPTERLPLAYQHIKMYDDDVSTTFHSCRPCIARLGNACIWKFHV